MKLVMENVGALTGPVEIVPGKLTVFVGGNNTGKTYAMYVLWRLLSQKNATELPCAADLVARLRATGSVQISVPEFLQSYWQEVEAGIGRSLSSDLGGLFGAPARFFSAARVAPAFDPAALPAFILTRPDFKQVVNFGEVSKLDLRFVSSASGTAIAITALGLESVPDSILHEFISLFLTDLVIRTQAEDAFLLPAERGGLNLFYDDLTVGGANDFFDDFAAQGLTRRSSKLRDSSLSQEDRDLQIMHHAQPLVAYLDFLRRIKRQVKSSGGFHDLAQALQKDIAKVSYQVTEDGIVTAKPETGQQVLGIHLTSSTVKNLYGLWAWLETRAKPGAWLMIDEPELNLHPDNQRQVARLLVRLVNRGIRVVISTHSDYIVREINNMIMLGTEFPERVAMEAQFGYDQAGSERLAAADVAAYHFTEQDVAPCAMSPEFGIEVASMDEAINRLNESNSAIYYALGEKLHPIEQTGQIVGTDE